LLAGVYAISSNDIRVGTNVEVDGAPWKVLGDKTAFLSLPSFIRRLFIHPRLLKDMQHCTSISFMETTHLVFIEKTKITSLRKMHIIVMQDMPVNFSPPNNRVPPRQAWKRRCFRQDKTA
jgi:hypothetical protein